MRFYVMSEASEAKSALASKLLKLNPWRRTLARKLPKPNPWRRTLASKLMKPDRWRRRTLVFSS